MALRENFSCSVSAMDLVEAPMTQQVFWSALKKNFLVTGCGYFVSDVISGGLLGHLGPLHLALGANY